MFKQLSFNRFFPVTSIVTSKNTMGRKSSILKTLIVTSIVTSMLLFASGQIFFLHSKTKSADHNFFLGMSFLEPEIGDYVLIENHFANNSIKLIKTLKASEGDTIQVQGPILKIENTEEEFSINEEKAEENHIHIIESQIIPEGKVFVLGSNLESFDSRYKEFGLVEKQNITAKVIGLW